MSHDSRSAGTIQLGDLVVNRLGFGALRICGDFAWGRSKDPDNARRVLHRALDLGVNFIDTADSYPLRPHTDAATLLVGLNRNDSTLFSPARLTASCGPTVSSQRLITELRIIAGPLAT